MVDLLSAEQVYATAARYLLDGGDYTAGEVLMLCTVECELSGESWMDGNLSMEGVLITLTGLRLVFDIINGPWNDLYGKIRDAFAAALKPFRYPSNIVAILEPPTLLPGWKEEIAERFRDQEMNNQAKDHSSPPPQRWQGLGFRSVTELVIARTLDAASVLFFPLPAARVTVFGEQRGTRVPDFLVCKNGKWGILEVDGEPHHPPGTAAKDGARDRLFKQYGVKVVEHYTASECYKDPAGTVRKFLELLAKNG